MTIDEKLKNIPTKEGEKEKEKESSLEPITDEIAVLNTSKNKSGKIKIEPAKEETEDELDKDEEELVKLLENVNVPAMNLTPLQRYSLLKVAVRKILLRKDVSGYQNRYYYIPLKKIQAAFTRLEAKFSLTSVFTQERIFHGEEVYYDYVRTCKDVKTGETVAQTRIDATDLINNKIDPRNKEVMDYFERILQIASPKDAWEMIFLNYFDPQKRGSFSTYFQRYTYFQLYDFQEVNYDDIEEKPQGKEKGKSDKNENANFKSQKEKRLEDTKLINLRTEIKENFGRDVIIENLPKGKKFNAMNLKELEEFEKTLMEKNQNNKEEK